MASDRTEPGTRPAGTRPRGRFARAEAEMYGALDETGLTVEDIDAALASPPLPEEAVRRVRGLGERQERQIELLERAGCKYPRITVEEAAGVGLPLSYAVAFLEKEASGTDRDGARKFGLNLFGHDAVANPVKGGFVSEERYAQYLAGRRAGRGAQGVGPCQLTWWEFQDRADALGGCWRPRFNLRVGFAIAKALIERHGKQAGAAHYNGTGAAADAYGRDWLARQERWHDTLQENTTPIVAAAPPAQAAAAHRHLEVRDPYLEGVDVEALQVAINQRRPGLRPIDDDGFYGERTDRLARVSAWRLGADESTLAKPTFPARLQGLVRGVREPNSEQAERASARTGKPAPKRFGAVAAAAVTGEAPRIVTAASMDLAFRDLFGELGPERFVTGHYTAGRRARTSDEGIEIVREVHREHAAKGWGGIGYHYVIADDGTLLCARPTILKGAHTAGHNTSNIGVCCPATTGDRPTDAQRATFRWLLANAHTENVPKAHRTDLDLGDAERRGHKQWPGNATACPGLFLDMYLHPDGSRRGGDADDPWQPPTRADARDGVVTDDRNVSDEEAADARTHRDAESFVPDDDPDFV